jgi:hypothetical protein
VCLCERWVWACMWLHRLARACQCARRRCGRRHQVRAWVRPPVYIANAHVMYEYMFLSMQIGACKWVRVCVRAYACDRVRALTMHEYAACVRVRRALFVRPSIDATRTYTVYVYTMHACIYIHARLATPTNGSPMRARRTHAPTCCVRALACAHVRYGARASAPTHASAFRRRRPRVASARRRSSRRRRSMRTSARGTPRLWRTWLMYAPPFRPGRRATAGGTRSAGRRCGADLLCGAGRCARRRRRCARTRVRSRVGPRKRGRPRV